MSLVNHFEQVVIIFATSLYLIFLDSKQIEELDFDRIGFEEFKREWAASLRSMPDEGNKKEGGKGNDDGTGRSKKAKDSHFPEMYYKGQ